MKRNNLSNVQTKINQRKYDHAIGLFKRLPTNIMYENFDKIINGFVLKHVFQKRNSDIIYDALKTQNNFYFVSYNSEILWNLLLLKKIALSIKRDLDAFELIEKNIFLNQLDGLYEIYENISDVAKKSHKGIELLVHIHQLKLITELPKFEDDYKTACIEQYISKIQFYVENSTLKERIHSDLPERSFAEYFIYKVTQELTEKDMLIVYAHIDRSYNDIDYYEDIINYLLETSMRADLHSTVVKALEDLYEITEDKRLLPLIYSSKKNYELDKYTLDKQIYFEYDLLADYEKVLNVTKNNIEEDNDDYCSYLFYIKSFVLTNSNEELYTDNLILSELFKHFKVIFNLSGDKVYYHAYTCLRLLDQYKICRWSRIFSTYIMAYLDKFSENNFRYFNFVYGFNYNFNPLRLYYYKNKRYHSYYPNCINFNALIESEDEYSNIDLSLEGKTNWIELLKYYRSNLVNFDFALKYPVEKILYFHLNYIYVNKLIENNNISDAIELVVKFIVENTQFYNLHPFNEIFDIVINDDFINPVYKLIIIYYKIYAFDPEENEERDLISNARILLESIIINYEVSRIDEFCNEYKNLNQNVLNFFLSHVWQIEFMKNTLVYESINEIQEERINICKKLIELDPSSEPKYLNELQEKIKTLEINKISNLIHASKVFVDVNSVKRTCLDRLDKSYESFKQLRSHSKEEQPTIFLVRDSNGEFNGEEEAIDLLEDFDTNKIINVNGYKFKALKIDQRSLLKFKHIISDVTNEFLMGATGLNSYLSTGIRHGILRNHLRNPIEKEQLLPSYLDRNLSNRIVDTLENKEVIYGLLQRFSDDIDNTIDFITERLIQISISYEFAFLYDSHDKFSQQSVNLNIFNYVFTFDEAEILISKGKSDLSSFIDDLINLLWLKTDACLLRMRHVLATTIKQRFREIFRQLIDSLIKIGESEQGDLINSIVIAESNFFKIFQEAQQWFNKNNVYQLPELQLSRCVEISKNIITRTIFSLKDWEGLKLEFNNDPYLSGRYVSDLVYMFLDLFNNAYQHSKLEPNELKIDLKILHCNGKVTIDAINNLNLNLIDIEETKTKLEGIRESIRNNKSKELAQKDSNSGLHKINNRISNEILFNESNLNFYVNENNSQFIVKIEFTINRS